MIGFVDPTLATSSGGFLVPGFSVRRANTTIELRDGQSFAIAGLYQDDFTDVGTHTWNCTPIPVEGSSWSDVKSRF